MYLERLDLASNGIGERGCAAVGALLKPGVAPCVDLNWFDDTSL